MNKSVSLYVTAASSLMPEILVEFKELYPSIKISIYQSKKNSANYDLHIYSSDYSVLESNSTQVLKESFCLAIPKNHKLVSLDEIDLYELRDEPFISLTSDLPLYTSTLQLCKQAGFIPKINLESNNPSIMIDFIKRGMGNCYYS